MIKAKHQAIMSIATQGEGVLSTRRPITAPARSPVAGNQKATGQDVHPLTDGGSNSSLQLEDEGNDHSGTRERAFSSLRSVSAALELLASEVSLPENQSLPTPFFPPQRNNYVRFHRQVEVLEIGYRNQDECKASWFSKEDFKRMEDDIDCTLKMIGAGLMDPEQRGDFCIHGLECDTVDIRRKRKNRIMNSRKAVFKMQRILDKVKGGDALMWAPDSIPFKYKHLTFEDEAYLIATVYEEQCIAAREKATRAGQCDSNVAALQWREDESPKLPTRRTTWAKAG